MTAPQRARPRHAFPSLFLALSVASGCAQCVPDRVAVGVSRLAIRHTAVMAKLIENDTTCGFGSEIVKRGVLVQGEPGQPGAVTYTVKDCTISFPTLRSVIKDCIGVEMSVKGEFTVSAQKRIVGTITGNPLKPIIPTVSDAVTVEVDATLSNFEVHKSTSPSSLNANTGAVHFVMQPHLALSKSLGLCSISTGDVSFTDVRFTKARLVLNDGKQDIPVDVPSSDLVAQVGKWRDEENSFSGRMKVWDSNISVPLSTDPNAVLDPDYTPESHFDAMACNADLVAPISYACPSLKDSITHGAARLTVSHMGTVASLVDADTRCGFSNAQVLASAQVSGTVGGPGSVTLTLPAPCTLSYPSTTPVRTDCAGLVTSVEGMASVTGTKTLTGILTGDPAQPIAPNSREPATLVLSTQFGNFKVSKSDSEKALTVVNGRLSGTMRPRVAIDTRSHFCSNSTPIVEFSNLEWTDANLSLFSGGLTFTLGVSQSNLDAQNGPGDTNTNHLTGVMIADGAPVTIPPFGSSPDLDPAYSPDEFMNSFSCAPGFQLANSDADCSVQAALAANVGRLTVSAAGALASMIQNDDTCGFSTLSVKINPTSVTGENGDQGSIQWNLENCRVGQPGAFLRSTDCLGGKNYVTGTGDVTAERVVNGERNSAFVIFDSIIPQTRNAMTINLQRVALAEFSAYTVTSSSAAPYAQLTFHSGTLSGTVIPGLGERISTPGVFDVPTPVATFTDIQLVNATAELAVAGKTFTLVIPAAQVSALNGSLNGASNKISGTVVLGDTTVMIPQGTALNPAFDQSSFDSSYACTADLASVIPPK